jgi:hypothetical protein
MKAQTQIMQSGSVSGLGTQCGKTNGKSERYAYATGAAQMSCGTECITKLPLLLCFMCRVRRAAGAKLMCESWQVTETHIPAHSHTVLHIRWLAIPTKRNYQ